MSVTVHASAAPDGGTTVPLAEIYNDTGVVFLWAGDVYETQQMVRAGEGYITVTRVSDGADHDVPSGSSVVVAKSAVLLAAF